MAIILKPSLKKVLVVNLIRTLSVVVVFVLLLMVAGISGLKWLSDSTNNFSWAVMIVLGFSCLLFFFRYLSIKSVSYSFRTDELVVERRICLFFKNQRRLNYHQIGGVSFEKKGFFQESMDFGVVKLDLSRVGGTDLKIKFVERPANIVRDVKELLRMYHVKEQREYIEKYKLNRVI
ncbi:MAG: hypothetical protein KKF65_06960 [Nanoarchaeota archaeon]|nr:hypothetical protein [Nanoarchaeota archaeon]